MSLSGRGVANLKLKFKHSLSVLTSWHHPSFAGSSTSLSTSLHPAATFLSRCPAKEAPGDCIRLQRKDWMGCNIRTGSRLCEPRVKAELRGSPKTLLRYLEQDYDGLITVDANPATAGLASLLPRLCARRIMQYYHHAGPPGGCALSLSDMNSELCVPSCLDRERISKAEPSKTSTETCTRNMLHLGH